MELPRLLIVDDEADNLAALKRLCRKDFDCTGAGSGEEALKILATQSWDVVLSDQRMPGIQGSELLEKIRRHDPLITRILLTGFSDIEAVIEAVNRGEIWRYVAKPWEPEELLLTLKQGAERSMLERSLLQSRRELERAVTELRAKDWSRERLLQVLLHELRTLPQIVEAVEALPSDEAPETRARFLKNLSGRLSALEADLNALLDDEKKIAALPQKHFHLSQLLKNEARLAANFQSIGDGQEPRVSGHEESLREILAHFLELLRANSARAPARLELDWSKSARPEVFLSLSIEGTAPLLPEGLKEQKLSPAVAWNALLEPFVGAENFAHHSRGLRVETARRVRQLHALGAKAAFEVGPKAQSVELLVVFPSV